MRFLVSFKEILYIFKLIIPPGEITVLFSKTFGTRKPRGTNFFFPALNRTGE